MSMVVSDTASWRLMKPRHLCPQVSERLWSPQHNGKAAKDVLFPELWSIGTQVLAGGGTLTMPTADGAVERIVVRMDLAQQNDSGALEKIVDDVIAANPDNVAQFQAGKDKAFNALVGQIMKASKGKANPQQASDLLRKKLG